MALSRMGAVGRTSGALPSALRSAAALHSASRRSFSWFSWGKEEEEDPKFFERQLHRLYSERVVPLEKKYNFPKFATPALRKATGGKAFPQMIFSHWQNMEGDALNPGTMSGKVVNQTRIRKGMAPEVPGFDNFYDKL